VQRLDRICENKPAKLPDSKAAYAYFLRWQNLAGLFTTLMPSTVGRRNLYVRVARRLSMNPRLISRRTTLGAPIIDYRRIHARSPFQATLRLRRGYMLDF
jgi:hypothetical protein